MRPFWLAGVAVVALVSGAAVAQGPESLLPPGFDRPAARPVRRPVDPDPVHAARRLADPDPVHAQQQQRRLVVDPDPVHAAQRLAAPAISVAPSVPVAAPVAVPGPISAGAVSLPAGINSFDQLMALPPDQLDTLLGLRSKTDIPENARRALRRNGLIDESEGGLAGESLVHQDAGLVGAAIAGNHGRLVSRWGHVLLRRALASRLDAPDGMDPAGFVAMRAALLTRMGEGDAARALVQDVDPDAYSPELTAAAIDAYTLTGDFTGICPIVAMNPSARKDAPWQMMRAICGVASGAATGGFAQLDHMVWVGAMPAVDMRLAQKYAGALGHGRRAVSIAWDGVEDMTPWRYALAMATGVAPPAKLVPADDVYYPQVTALAPMVGLGLRADASDRAGAAGVLSSAAMVDLYSQIYADDDVTGGAADRALQLRDAYVAASPADRLKAMQALWGDGAADDVHYGRMVLTAYAAARLPVSADMASAAGDLIASMLAAGLDGNAMRWSGVCEAGSQGWALLALAAPVAHGDVDGDALETYRKADTSSGARKTAFLVAGLAGLGRISAGVRDDEAGRLGVNFAAATRWTQAIDGAAAVGNPELVALLAGLGMQGDSWGRMTPRYLYHIVAALTRVGRGGEARMIAAEAVARG